MENFDLKTLEFEKIIYELEKRAYSDGAKELAKSLQPSDDFEVVQKCLCDSYAAQNLILTRGEVPLSGLSDIKSIVNRSERDACLSCKDLLQIARFLRATASMNDFAYRARIALEENREFNQLTSKVDAEDKLIRQLSSGSNENLLNDNTKLHFSSLMNFLHIFDSLISLNNLENRIDRAILSEDEVADNASNELATIRKKIKDVQQSIKIYLDNVIKNDSEYLSDSIYTQRDGRYVIPVKSAQKSKIKGLVHDASSSGQTLFIEPIAVVESNNKIRELQIAEKKEIERILFDFSQEIKLAADSLKLSNSSAIEIDFIHAKGKLAIEWKANLPKINNRGYISLKNVRHPLIAKDKVVPIDILLGDSYSTLVITGPNTGGKTVALKTCGLMSLMAMSGLLLPCQENSEISTFSKVLADIGDEQSIEQNLSTFSSHMKHIVEILDFADDKSLILLDELGSGTDPAEGAALAISILEELRNLGSKVLSSTHYKELKVYALETEEVENASCEFDIDSLKPTYKLLIGIPGVSNAFVISKKLGLSDRLIDRAKKNLTADSLKFEAVLADAENKRRQYNNAKAEVDKLEADLKKRENEITREELFITQKKQEIINSTREENRQIFRDKLKITEMLLDEIKQAIKGQDYTQAHKLGSELKLSLRNEISDIENKITSNLVKGNSFGKKIEKDDLKIGELYYVPLLGKNAKLLEVIKNKKVLVQADNLRTTVDITALEEAKTVNNFDNEKKYGKGLKSQFSRSSKSQKSSKSSMSPWSSKSDRMHQSNKSNHSSINLEAKMYFSPEIKLIGMRVDEAEVEVEKFLDAAVLASVKQLRIVHGKGTGALRNMVKSRLNKDKRVLNFSDAPYGQGDAGVTVVELK